MTIVPLDRLLPVRENLRSAQCYARRAVEPGGVMLHFDDSSEDEWAVAWFKDPRCKVSYTRLYLDSGDVVQVTPSLAEAAWHAGKCRTPNANSYFYGLAAATNAKVAVTEKQFAAMRDDVIRIFEFHRWTAADVDRRIRGHNEEAVPAGRKIDPVGLNPAKPILDLVAFRQAVREHLAAA